MKGPSPGRIAAAPFQALCVVLSAALAASCGGPKEPPARHVLLITLDTTRADSLGCYGSARNETPALDALAAEGLQSDTRFAEAFISSRFRQGKGPVRIWSELSQRGFDRSAIAAALEQSGYDWFALAVEVRAQRFGDAAPEDFKARARQLQFLAYRGFDSEQAQAAVPGG